MTVFDWIGLAFLVPFVVSWMFLEYFAFEGIERAFRRFQEWWRR